MFLNSVYSEVVISLRIFNLVIGCLCLITLYKSWTYIRQEPYRKHGGEGTVNTVVFMLLTTAGLLVMAFAVDDKRLMGKSSSISMIAFEIYQLLTVFSWSAIKVTTLQSCLQMYRWPSLNLKTRCLCAYAAPAVITSIFCGILSSGGSFLLIQTSRKPFVRKCTIESCDINLNTETRALVACLVLAPMIVITIALTVQIIRCSMVANTAWDAQNFTLTRKIIAFCKRRHLIRGTLDVLALTCIVAITTVLVFTKEENRQSAKIIYSIFVSSIILVKFINSCILTTMEWSIFTVFKIRCQTKPIKKNKEDGIELGRHRSPNNDLGMEL